MLYPDSRFRMSEQTLESYLRQLIEAHSRVPEVTIAWQGGEPTLMGLDFFRKSIEITKKYLKPGQRALHTIQTNGTMLDAEWAPSFKEHDFLVGISIDGPGEIHDAYRVTRGGSGSFDQVMRGLDFLRAAGVDWNVLTTVHAANADRGREVYCFLRDELRRAVHPVHSDHRTSPRERRRRHGAVVVVAGSAALRPEGDVVTGRSVSGEGYGRFLIDVFEEWVRRDIGGVYVQMFDVALANWYGEPPSLCIHSETCGGALAMEHNGDLYSCDHFVEPDHLLGNIADSDMVDLVDSGAGAVRQRQADTAADVLPGVRCALRLPRRVPEGQVHRHPRRRARPQLPL